MCSARLGPLLEASDWSDWNGSGGGGQRPAGPAGGDVAWVVSAR